VGLYTVSAMALARSIDRSSAPPPSWHDVNWGGHQRWVSVSGGAVNVIALGSGPPVVFVHGLAGCWQNWLEQLLPFAVEHRAVALDLPGFGASPMPAGPITISGYAQVIDEVCDALGLDAVAVVGNSMGGFIAAELAIRFPARVERLVLVSAAGISVEHQRSTYERALRGERLLSAYGGWLASRSENVVRRDRLRRAVMRLVAAHPDLIEAPLAFEQLRGSGKPGFIHALDALTSYPIRERLPEIACPTLVMWGEDDRLVPLSDASVFEELIPRARKVIFPDTGHVPMLERPTEFNAELRRFLSE
jgi:pimeloyl-ACP methyl ester carboxylesterase